MARRIFTAPLLLSIFVFLLYFPMVGPSVASQGDSGELVTVAYLLGIAHPPGYPLFTMIAHLFSLFPWGSVAWRINLFSAVAQAISIGILYLVLFRFTKNLVAAVSGCLALAFSYSFWLYGLVAEVFPLNDLIFVLLIYLVAVLSQERALQKQYVLAFALSLLFGLGMSNHHTVVFILPVAFYVLYPAMKQFLRKRSFMQILVIIFLAAMGLLLGLLPYAYLLFRAKVAVLPVSWAYPETLLALWHMFSRADYGTFTALSGRDPALATIGDKAAQIVNYFRFLLDDFGAAGVGLAIGGVLVGYRRLRKETVAILIGFFFTAIFFLSYANFPLNEFTGTGLSVLERFYLLPNIFVAMAIGLGIKFALEFSRRIPIFRLTAVFFVALYLFMLGVSHYRLVDQKDNYLAFNFGKNILRGAAPDSYIILQGDIATFTAFYARYVENFRSDVEFFTPNQVSSDNQYRYLRKARPELDLSLPGASSPSGLIWQNYKVTRIYSLGPPSFKLSGLSASPSGLLFEIRPETQLLPYGNWIVTNREILGEYDLPSGNDLKSRTTIADGAIITYYVRMYGLLGDACRSYNQAECAVGFYLKGLELEPTDYLNSLGLAKALELSGQCDKAEGIYKRYMEIDPTNEQVISGIYGLYENCFKDKDRAKYYLDLWNGIIRRKEGSLKDL